MLMLVIELGLVLAALMVALTFPTAGSNWFAALERRFVELAQRRALSVAVVGITALALRAALLPILPVPQPGEHDEFSYLLAGDTFAHGRLTNPTHPMRRHLETFHILQKPTYSSVFPPAQGLALAAGQVIAGHPFWGVWFSVGLMCATICWMLQSWMPPGWALLGGFLVTIRLGSFSYWDNSYWGGAVAATGGALVLGALPRIERYNRVRDALLMGLGLAILANSRPYEGLVFSLPAAAAMLAWLFGKNRPPLGLTARRVLAPLLLVLALTAGAMGYYFWCVTGNPARMPLQVFIDTYQPVPPFIWQRLRPLPTYPYKLMHDYYTGFAVPYFMATRSLSGLCILVRRMLTFTWLFYLGPVFLLPFLTAAVAAPYGFSWKHFDPGTRFLLVATGTSTAGLALEVIFVPHHAAPMTCLIIALVLLAMRYGQSWQWRGKPTGLALMRAVPLICVALLVLRATATPLHLPLPDWWPPIWCSPGDQMLDRAHILSQLQDSPGRHLVIVHYLPTHNYHREWVYNAADIDDAKVVWAQDMGLAENQELINYFKDRRVWLVEPDQNPPRLSPYPGSAVP